MRDPEWIRNRIRDFEDTILAHEQDIAEMRKAIDELEDELTQISEEEGTEPYDVNNVGYEAGYAYAAGYHE